MDKIDQECFEQDSDGYVLQGKNVASYQGFQYARDPKIFNSHVVGCQIFQYAKRAVIIDSNLTGYQVLRDAIEPTIINSKVVGVHNLQDAEKPIVYNSELLGEKILKSAEGAIIISDPKDGERIKINDITYTVDPNQIGKSGIVVVREIPTFDFPEGGVRDYMISIVDSLEEQSGTGELEKKI